MGKIIESRARTHSNGLEQLLRSQERRMENKITGTYRITLKSFKRELRQITICIPLTIDLSFVSESPRGIN